MKITILAVGKLKERFYKDAVAEYVKRLSAYCTLEIVEVADERTKENLTEAERKLILDREADRIFERIPERSCVVALCIAARQRSSEEMAQWLRDRMSAGYSHITFLIGGSVGLSERVIQRAQEQLSFSALTFPHQLMRVILAEQLYRWFRIMRGEPYHK